MERHEIIKRLNWFYTVELNQVDLYSEQSKQVDDLYLKKMLEKVATIEQGHVDNLREQILTYGGKPTILGETIAPATGKVVGFLTGKAGLVRMLEANIELEVKAMKDYKDFILNAGEDQALFDLLWSNLLDEDLHTAWFVNKVAELKEMNPA